MASVKLTPEEWKKLTADRRMSPWRKLPLLGILIMIFALAAVTRQYAFLALGGLIVLFVLFTVYLSLKTGKRGGHSIFSQEPYEVMLRSDGYTVVVGESRLELSRADITFVHDFKSYYSLVHDTNVCVLLPKSLLTDKEKELVEEYRKERPDFPRENIRRNGESRSSSGFSDRPS